MSLKKQINKIRDWWYFRTHTLETNPIIDLMEGFRSPEEVKRLKEIENLEDALRVELCGLKQKLRSLTNGTYSMDNSFYVVSGKFSVKVTKKVLPVKFDTLYPGEYNTFSTKEIAFKLPIEGVTKLVQDLITKYNEEHYQ